MQGCGSNLCPQAEHQRYPESPANAWPLSRAELSDVTGLTRSTVSSVINRLLSHCFVHEIGLQHSGRGRPGMLLALHPDAGCAVGVEIGVNFISVILTDFVAHILKRQRVATSGEEEQEVTSRRILLRRLSRRTGLHLPDCRCWLGQWDCYR